MAGRRTGWRWGYALFGITLLGAAAYATYGRLPGSAPEGETARTSKGLPLIATDPSIAVLPFVNMSSDKEQEFFSDGIAEELLNFLGKVP